MINWLDSTYNLFKYILLISTYLVDKRVQIDEVVHNYFFYFFPVDFSPEFIQIYHVLHQNQGIQP